MGCSGCGMFGMWDVRDVGCSGCGMFGMWNVPDVGCSGCGMFAGMWDVDLQNTVLYRPSFKTVILSRYLKVGIVTSYSMDKVFNGRFEPEFSVSMLKEISAFVNLKMKSLSSGNIHLIYINIYICIYIHMTLSEVYLQIYFTWVMELGQFCWGATAIILY